jgi:hypothetical protein
MKLGMYIMATEPISTAYLINPSHQSVCLYVHPPPRIVAKQRLGRNIPVATNTCNNKTTVRCVVFYAVRVVSKGSTRLVLPELLVMYNNENSERKYSRQKKSW